MAYTLTSSAKSVDEGSSVTINVYTVGLANGTLLPYSIYGTGIDVNDFDGLRSLDGNFRIVDNKASVTLYPKRDRKTELNEVFTLRLTSTGNDESIDITINDTSVTTGIVAKFYVTSTSSVVREGDIARFDITALNLTSGTVVPYKILGITQSDLTGDAQSTGYLTFVSNVTINETYANVTLPIFEDFIQEGFESIVLLLEPDFPYTLELASTITVLDTSVSVEPTYNISANKTTFKEGESITFTLSTTNVPDGTIVQWKLQPYPEMNDTLTLQDFDNLESFSGTFPPLSGGVATVTFSSRDDFIYEQTEQFYLIIPGTFVTSQVIRLLDSGNTFITSDGTFTGNIVVKCLDAAVLRANLGSLATGVSYWQDTTGLLSENMVLQGKTPFATEESLALYHPFSYVIRSKISMEKWKDSIKPLLHPAGMTLFSEINNETDPTEVLSLEVKTTENIIIRTIDSFTVDDTEVNAGNTTYAGENLTVDSLSLSSIT